jgi:hypothetical protein
MVVSGALVWCRRDGQLLPLRLDSIKLSGALTQAHWDAVTQFLDLVASQRLIIQDEGMSVQLTPRSLVSDDIPKFTDNFANLIQEQKCSEKYCLSDCDGGRRTVGLGRLSREQEYGDGNALLWHRKQQNSHVEIKAKEEIQQNDLNKESEVINTKLMKNVVEKTQGIRLDSERNVKQDAVQKFGIFNHDEGWKPETCEETHKVATVSKCGQQQRRRRTGLVCSTLNLQNMLQHLKQQVKRTEEVVAVLNCQECEQSRHVSSGSGDSPSRALNLRCKQEPAEALVDRNCNQCEIRENGLRRQMQETNGNCGVEASSCGSNCHSQQNYLHWPVNDNSSSGFLLSNVLSCQDELQKLYPQWQILKAAEPGECTSESTSCQTFKSQVSGKSCVNRFKQDMSPGLVAAGNESIGHRCSSVSWGTSEMYFGDLFSVQESVQQCRSEVAREMRPEDRQRHVLAFCEQCDFGLSEAAMRLGDRDEIKHAFSQLDTSDQSHPSVCCYRCALEQEILKAADQIPLRSQKKVSSPRQKCGSRCNLFSDVHMCSYNACHGANTLRYKIRSCDRHFNEQQINQRIQFPHVDQNGGEQQVIQTCELDRRILCSSPVSYKILPKRQRNNSVSSHFAPEERTMGLEMPVSNPIQTKCQTNSPGRQHHGLEERTCQTSMSERNKVHLKCHEAASGCQELELRKQRKTPEVDQRGSCQQCDLEKRTFQTVTPERNKVYIKGHEDVLGCEECELQNQRMAQKVGEGADCQRCEFGKRIFQTGTLERNEVSKCQEDTSGHHNCALETQMRTPEVDQVSGCQQCDLDERISSCVAEDKIRRECTGGAPAKETSECDQEGKISSEVPRHQYWEEQEGGVHHKKKRAVALWQRLLRKHVTSSSNKRKLVSVAVVQPSSSTSRL